MMYYCLNQYSIYTFCFPKTLLLRSIDSNLNNRLPSFSQTDRRQSTVINRTACVLCQSIYFAFGNLSSLHSSCGIPMFFLLFRFAGKVAVPTLQKVEHTSTTYSFPQKISAVRSLT